jgi:hypothetical protein
MIDVGVTDENVGDLMRNPGRQSSSFTQIEKQTAPLMLQPDVK